MPHIDIWWVIIGILLFCMLIIILTLMGQAELDRTARRDLYRVKGKHER